MGRNVDCEDVLSGVREESLQSGGENACPDESLGNRVVGCVEPVQVGVGLPLLEKEFDLPAQSVDLAYLICRENSAREICGSPRRLMGTARSPC